jgi:hypothetical protein
MDGVKSNNDIGEWLGTFQQKVNTVTGYEGLVFTVSIWREKENDEVGHPKAEVVRSSYFAFLDMKMTWSEESDLRFGVYLKLGQELKYLNNSDPAPPPLLQSNNERSIRSTCQSDLTDEQIEVQVHQGPLSLTPSSTQICGPSTKVCPYTSRSSRLEHGKEKCKEEKKG